MALKSSEIIAKWRIICDSMDYNSLDAVETTFKQWKNYILTSVSKDSDKTMLMSAAQNNNIRVCTFLLNELHELNPFKKVDDKHTEIALELAIKHGNYIIAKELLSRNQQLLKVNAAIKSPVYHVDAKYLCAKINALLKEFNQLTWVEYEELNLMPEATLAKIKDKNAISIDKMDDNSIFFALLNNNKDFEFQYDKNARFYYTKYAHIEEILQLNIVFTTPLIEALELNNQDMIDHFINNKIIYPYDIEHISGQIAESKICDARILVYKETLAKLSDDKKMSELRSAIKKGNYLIAKKLLNENTKSELLPVIKSPIYNSESTYLHNKMNLLLKDISRIEYKNLHLEVQDAYAETLTADKYIKSIDKMDEATSIFFRLLNNNKPEKFKYNSRHRFYYNKYIYTGSKLKRTIIFTTPLIEALELDYRELVDYYIENKIIYEYDRGYIAASPGYKDILSKII